MTYLGCQKQGDQQVFRCIFASSYHSFIRINCLRSGKNNMHNTSLARNQGTESLRSMHGVRVLPVFFTAVSQMVEISLKSGFIL
jgi:hypothetical protein